MANNGLLTARVVEEIQRAAADGRPVSAFISALHEATLAGLVEYGCLRRSVKGLPPLPPSIASSALGKALTEVVSEIGLRASGVTTAISVSHQPREVEFVTVKSESQLTSHPMKMFFMRFTQASKAANFPTKTANELQAAFMEMIDNAICHASSPIPVLAGYYVRPTISQFVVADVGRGVRDTLRENPKFSEIKNDAEAIQLALHDGVSRFEDRGGFGFLPIFKALAEAWGVLRFRSQEGCWTVDGQQVDADYGVRHFPPALPGFQVSVTCCLEASSAVSASI
jgi:hypothetical protein